MRAVVIDKITPAERIEITDIPVPKVKSGWVLIKVKAFGLNHSEQILRLNEIQAAYIQKPIVPGIECTGIIADPSDSRFRKGQKVMAMMGGMGRNFNGSYAEYILCPVHHVFAVNSSLSWEQLAVVGETYFTAWGSLFEGLHLIKNDTLLVRGATCALGYAAVQMAKAVGCRVIASTHRREKMNLLNGADLILLDEGNLKKAVQGVDKALELVGVKTLEDTFSWMKKGGIICVTGNLGKKYVLTNFDPIKDIPNSKYLTGFFSNFPTQKIIDDMFAFLHKNNLEPKIGEVFSFADVKKACIMQDTGKISGKIIIKVE